MSSWKKSSKTNQKTHRERHQPESRKHLGLLEKKKDYRLRAKDAHQKEETLKLLHKRALNKNPDEFYHHMIRSKIEDDEHHEFEQEDEHTKEQMALMQSQDMKYIIMKRNIESKKIERLQSELHMVDVANKVKNKHIFFVDDDKETKNFNLTEKLDTHSNLLGRRTNRIKVNDLANINIDNIDENILKAMVMKRENAYKELSKRIEREKELTIIQQKMEMKRAIQAKRLLKPKRIKSGTKNSAPVYEFKYERKK